MEGAEPEVQPFGARLNIHQETSNCSSCYSEIEVSDNKDKWQEKGALRMCAGQCDKILCDLYQYEALSEFGYCDTKGE